MAKFGAIKFNKYLQNIKSFYLMETKQQIRLIKFAVIGLSALFVLYHAINIFMGMAEHAESLKTGENDVALLGADVERKKSEYADLTISYADKLAHTVEVDDIKKDVGELYSALTVTGLVKIDNLQVNLKKASEASQCYNKADIAVVFSSDYRDVSLFDDMVGYFTEVFLVDSKYRSSGIQNGHLLLEYTYKK